MHPNEFAIQEGRRHRRQFSPQFKTDIVAQCQGHGISVAAVARQYDLHPNLLRKWIQAHERLGRLEPGPAVCRLAARSHAMIRIHQYLKRQWPLMRPCQCVFTG